MPFIERPTGFSSETLDLLDRAMMGIWLDHVAVTNAEREAASVKSELAPVVSAKGSLLVYRAR